MEDEERGYKQWETTKRKGEIIVLCEINYQDNHISENCNLEKYKKV